VTYFDWSASTDQKIVIPWRVIDGAGAQPEVGRAAAEEAIDEIRDHLTGAHMVFITAGMAAVRAPGQRPLSLRPRVSTGPL